MGMYCRSSNFNATIDAIVFSNANIFVMNFDLKRILVTLLLSLTVRFSQFATHDTLIRDSDLTTD